MPVHWSWSRALLTGGLILRTLRLFTNDYFRTFTTSPGRYAMLTLLRAGVGFAKLCTLKTPSRRSFLGYLCRLDKQAFIQRLAYFSGELNALHPFREGNGRTLRIFQQLAAHAGYELSYYEADEEGLLNADIAAFSGDLAPLVAILERIVDVSAE